MYSLLFVVSSAVLLASASALPHRRSLRIPIQKKSNLVENGQANIQNLRSHIAHVAEKYSKGAAATASSTSSGNTTIRRGSDLLTDGGNAYWYGTVSVGSPLVEYIVDFDTGSSDFILPAKQCDATCDGHTRYDPSASSSAVDQNQPFQIAYGDGSTLAGEQYTDEVNIAGLVAKTQTMGAALKYSSGFQIVNFAPDGIMGMAFPGLSVMQGNPVVQTLVAEGQLSDPVFAFKLANSGSELYLGGIDNSFYTGSITYTAVTQQQYWQINVASVDVNGYAFGENIPAIVDTGTTLIVADPKIVSQFYASLNGTSIGNGLYKMPCDAIPNVSFTIEGKCFSIPAEVFNLGTSDASGSECVGALVGMGTPEGMWILGDVFLRNFYTVFDLGQMRVGFADLA